MIAARPPYAGQPASGGGPGRGGADLRDPTLDRAGSRPGQGQAELGRPPAPRPRSPDQLGHGRLRLALLYPGLTKPPPAEEVRTLAHPPVAERRTTGRRAVKPVENGVPDHVRERVRSAHRDRAAPSCPKRAGPPQWSLRSRDRPRCLLTARLPAGIR